MIPEYFTAVNKLAVEASLASPLADNLEEIELWPLDARKGSFRTFLINERVLLVLKLRIAFDLLAGKSFCIGYERVTFAPLGYGEDEEVSESDCVAVKNVLYRQPLSYDAFLDNLLSAGIVTIDANCFFVNSKLLWSKKGRLKNPFRGEDDEYVDEFFESSFFFASDGSIVFEDNKVYATPQIAQEIKTIISNLSGELNRFLDEFCGPDSIGVSHEYYVEWFQKLFPGKIKYRTLPNNTL